MDTDKQVKELLKFRENNLMETARVLADVNKRLQEVSFF